jgi:hypothetical protein
MRQSQLHIKVGRNSRLLAAISAARHVCNQQAFSRNNVNKSAARHVRDQQAFSRNSTGGSQQHDMCAISRPSAAIIREGLSSTVCAQSAGLQPQ